MKSKIIFLCLCLFLPLFLTGCDKEHITETSLPHDEDRADPGETMEEVLVPETENILASGCGITVRLLPTDLSLGAASTVEIVPASGEPVTLRFYSDNGVTAVVADADTVRFTVYSGTCRYEEDYTPSTGNRRSCYQEMGDLAAKMGLTDALSLRYAAYYAGDVVCVDAEAVTATEYVVYHAAGDAVILEKSPLTHTGTPDEAAIKAHFQTMVRLVEYENALAENTCHNPLPEDGRYFRNEYCAVNTPETLRYVFSRFLAESDVRALLRKTNASGDVWWKSDADGYLYVSLVSFGLRAYPEQPMEITQVSDTRFDVRIGARTFGYVLSDRLALSDGLWRWQLEPAADDGNGGAVSKETDPTPEQAAQAELLTEQLITRVMTQDWLHDAYSFTEEDLHWFLVTMLCYRDTPDYPYVAYLTETEEDVTITREDAYRALYEVFGIEIADTFLADSELYDAAADVYRFPRGAGSNTTAFQYENMRTSADVAYVYVDCDLHRSRGYDWEWMYFGRWRFAYRCEEKENGSFLRLIDLFKYDS